MPRPLIFVTIAAVLIALLPLPYFYYQLLLFLVCGVCAFAAYELRDSLLMPWLLGVVAVVYNPIVPIHLGREIWTVVNVVTVPILIFADRLRPSKDA
jgi:hypothetical protein